MGLLTTGTALSYEQIHAIASKLRRRGVAQFVRHFERTNAVEGDPDLWGDEVECTLVQFDKDISVKCLLAATKLLRLVEQRQGSLSAEWQPEYAAFMVEGVPTKPYNGLKECVWRVESEMRARRREINSMLGEGQQLMTLSCYPLIGVPEFCYPATEEPDTSQSMSISGMFPDQAINLDFAHFPTVTKVITERRGQPVYAQVPIFVDENTPCPFVDDLDGRDDRFNLVKEGYILLDAMPFGPCCCSLQTTFGCSSLESMLQLRDQLIPLAPIMLALTAATPILRGYLCDTDCRWDLLKQCLDDRTESERAGNKSYCGAGKVTTSRCDSADSYCTKGLEIYNDIALPIDVHAYNELIKADVPAGFARGIAHLFIREPLQVFEESLQQLDETDSLEMFEDIHLFHWRTVRTKLPPIDRSSGWKVEFRPMEVQPTDFQNAAFAVFAFLVSKVIAEGELRMEAPISMVFDNMSRAGARDAIHTQKFWWPQNSTISRPEPDLGNPESDMCEMTLDEIMNGENGVCKCVRNWLDAKESLGEICSSEKSSLLRYIDLVANRANGSAPTPASWMRKFVRSHSEYKFDSRVSQSIACDMLRRLHTMDDDTQ